jgi:bifunctional ADP-heptose synthase (sugar kinase/adenylyltransferase)
MLNNTEFTASNFSRKIPSDFLKRNSIDLKDIKKQILQFNDVRVCVIGDLIIDEYINCHPIGMSREEPTLVVTPIDSQNFLGGAVIVAAHTAALGAKTTLISIIGKDESGSWGSAEASRYGVTFKAISDKTRPTNLKQRYRSGSHSLLKVSHLSQDKVTKLIQDQIISEFLRLAPNIDLLILSDFSYGVFTKEIAEIPHRRQRRSLGRIRSRFETTARGGADAG